MNSEWWLLVHFQVKGCFWYINYIGKLICIYHLIKLSGLLSDLEVVKYTSINMTLQNVQNIVTLLFMMNFWQLNILNLIFFLAVNLTGYFLECIFFPKKI